MGTLLPFIDVDSAFFPSLLREHVELENLQGEHARLLEEAKKEKVFYYFPLLFLCSKNRGENPQLCLLCVFLQLLLTNQLEMEKMKVEQEKKKCYLAQEALKEKVTLLRTKLN